MTVSQLVQMILSDSNGSSCVACDPFALGLFTTEQREGLGLGFRGSLSPALDQCLHGTEPRNRPEKKTKYQAQSQPQKY